MQIDAPCTFNIIIITKIVVVTDSFFAGLDIRRKEEPFGGKEIEDPIYWSVTSINLF